MLSFQSLFEFSPTFFLERFSVFDKDYGLYDVQERRNRLKREPKSSGI